MATFAFFTQRGFMGVILAMAGQASRGEFSLIERLAMAAVAFHRAVPVTQCKVRIAIMTEGWRFPALGFVTGFAARAEMSFVCVVLAMAGQAILGRIGITLAGMAVGAFDLSVAHQ